MSNQTVKAEVSFNRTVNNWHSARPVFSAFIAAHPELGMRDSPITFRNFCHRHGSILRQLDVMRKPFGLRSSAIVDMNRFDEVVFNLLSLRSWPHDSASAFAGSLTQEGADGTSPSGLEA